MKNWFITLAGKPVLIRKKGAAFIVFEGLDGSGQSTQAKLLRDFLVKEGYEVVLTKEPTLDSQAGKRIRKILDVYPSTRPKKEFHKKLQKLFAQDRKEHLKKLILPSLKKGKIVISDRYFFSSFAYGAAFGVSLDWLIKLNEKFLLPDLTFILKVSPKICLKRIEKRKKKRTLFEEKGRLEKIGKIYQILAKRFKNLYPSSLIKGGRVYPIEGEKSIQKVFSQVRKILVSKFIF